MKNKKKVLSSPGLVGDETNSFFDEGGHRDTKFRRELHQVLEKSLPADLLVWTSWFPDEFYRELFRLKNWLWNPSLIKRPSSLGKLVINLVYERLTPGVLDDLRQTTHQRRKEKTRYRYHHEEIGHFELQRHIYAVTALMKAAANWRVFYRALQRAFPKYNEMNNLER